MSVTDCVQDAVSDGGLHRPHQDIGVFVAIDRDFAHHDGGWFHHDVAVQYGKDLGVTFDLVADQIGDRDTDRAIQFTDHNFGFRRRPGRAIFDECFTVRRTIRPAEVAFEVFLEPFSWALVVFVFFFFWP